MTKSEVLAPFLQAFASPDPSEGGCPEVPPCPPPCVPPPMSGAEARAARAALGGRYALDS